MAIIIKLREIQKDIINSVKQLHRYSPNVIVFIIYGLLYDIVLNLYKPFAIKFLERLGGNEFHISLYNSLPGLVAVFALIPGSLIINRSHNQKKTTSIFFALSRTFLLLIAGIPLLDGEYKPLLFVVLLSLMNLPDAVSQTSLQSYLGNVFDGRMRATAIMLRNKFGNIFVLMVTLITGIIIRFVPKNENQTIIAYQFFFVLAFLIGLIEISVFRRFKEKSSDRKEPALPVGSTKPNWAAVKESLQDKTFTRFLITTLIFYFTWQAGWPISSIYQVITLGANELWLAISAVFSGLSAFCFAGFWNKQISKKGNEATFVLLAFCMALNMFLIFLSPNIIIFSLVSIYGGFATMGVNTCLLNGLLNATPNNNRVIYIAVYNTFVNISLAISPIVSYIVLRIVDTRWALLVITGMRVCTALIILFNYLRHKKAHNNEVKAG